MLETYSSVMLVREGDLGAADGGGEQDCLRSPPETFFPVELMMNTTLMIINNREITTKIMSAELI